MDKLKEQVTISLISVARTRLYGSKDLEVFSFTITFDDTNLCEFITLTPESD